MLLPFVGIEMLPTNGPDIGFGKDETKISQKILTAFIIICYSFEQIFYSSK